MADEETQRAGDATRAEAARGVGDEPEGAWRRRPLPPIERLVLQPPFEAREDGRYYVSELLSFHDRNFIEAAFAAALGREADPSEVEAALADLRLGRRTKLEIVEQLAESAEGRGAGATERIEGIGRGGLSSRVRDLPFVGELWRVLAGIRRLPLLMRHQQQLEAYTAAQLQVVADYINSQDARVETYINSQDARVEIYVNEQRQRIHDYINDELRPVLADTADAVSMLSDALVSMRARIEEQQLRLDGQEEFLVQEKHEIVEAQKAALAEIEGRLGALVAGQRESLDGQRRALAELSARVEALRASVESVRAAAGEKV